MEKLEDELLSDEMDIITIEDIDELDGQEFEEFVANLYEKEGYETTLTKTTGDQGVDIIAEDLDERIAIQTKCYTDKVPNSAVQEAIAGANHYDCNRAIVVTNSYFTNSAIELADSNNVELIDRDELIELIDRHFL